MTHTKPKSAAGSLSDTVQDKVQFVIRQPWTPYAAGAILAFGMLVLALWVMGASTRDQILPGVTIGPVAIGNLTVEEAATRLAATLADFQELPLQFEGTDPGDHQIILGTWGIRPDATATALEAYRLTNSENPFLNSYHRIRNWFRPIEMTMLVRLDRPEFDAARAAFLAEVNQPVQDAKLLYEGNDWLIIPEVIGWEVDPELIERKILEASARLAIEPIVITPTQIEPVIVAGMLDAALLEARQLTALPILLVDAIENDQIEIETSQLASWTEVVAEAALGSPLEFRLNESKVRSYVLTLAEQLNRGAVNARVVFEEGELKIPQVSRTGRTLDVDLAIATIQQALLATGAGRTITLTFAEQQPEVSSETLSTLGLKELIGQATTSFAGSPANREHNIANGFSFLTGKLVKPNEQFSVVNALGAVDDTTGYLPELVIKENRTTPEYGGGLCQVSTTLFRAALNAGLEITERRNHSYRVSYYERDVGPGLDATIYLPSPDLKFQNDTPGWILIQGAVDREADTITFEFYGTSDGRTSTISKPTILSQTPAPDPIYIETSDLPKGETKQIEKPHGGAKTVVAYSVSRGGEIIHEQTFSSTYRPWPARYLVGTAEPTPAPSPAEAPPA